MTREFEDQLSFSRGFWPNQGLIGSDRIPNTLIAGRNLWCEGPGVLTSWGGATSVPGSFGNSVMNLIGTQFYSMTTGSACLYRGGAIFYIGSGTFAVGTDSTVTFYTGGNAASTTLRATLPTMAGQSFAVGLPIPNAPLLEQGAVIGATDPPMPIGTYSARATLVRTSTNAESTVSPVSNTIVMDGARRINVTLTAANVNIMDGPFKYRLYLSRKGQPDEEHYFYKEYTFPQSPFEIAFINGDLNEEEIPPLDNDAPLAGTHVFALGSVLIVGGIAGGGGLQFSKRGRPEAFSPAAITFLNPNEPIIGIRGRPADGWQYVFCRNSLHAVSLQNDDAAPIRVVAIWPDTGIANASAAAYVGGEFYCISLKKGVQRTTQANQTAEGDGTFALPIETVTDLWTATSTTVGWDQASDAVFFFAPDPDDTGNTVALAYMRKQNIWSLPFYLSDAGITGIVTSCVTYQGRLIFAIAGQLFEMTGSSSTIPWEAVPSWRDGGAGGWYKTITGYTTAADTGTNDYTTDLLINFDTTDVKSSVTTSRSGATFAGYNNWKKTNVKGVVTYTIRYSGTGAGQKVFSSALVGGITKIRCR